MAKVESGRGEGKHGRHGDGGGGGAGRPGQRALLAGSLRSGLASGKESRGGEGVRTVEREEESKQENSGPRWAGW